MLRNGKRKAEEKVYYIRQHRTNEAVGRRMDFSSDVNANSEGLLEVTRGICMPQMAERTESDAPPNCAMLPLSIGEGKTLREIAKILQRSPSTLSRELRRNCEKKRGSTPELVEA